MSSTDMKNRPLPSARDERVLVEQVGDETVVYDLESKDIHCLGVLASVVFRHCDGATTASEAARRAEDELGRPVSADEILHALAQLEERKLIGSPSLMLHNGNGGMSRRDLVRKSSALAGAAVFAAPIITSIVAPTAAMATSGIATGCSGCGKNSDCTSNHCCQTNGGKQCSQGCCVGANNSCHFCNCTGNTCQCTVTPADAGIGQCPCICGTPGCVNVPCCPTLKESCCTTVPAC